METTCAEPSANGDPGMTLGGVPHALGNAAVGGLDVVSLLVSSSPHIQEEKEKCVNNGLTLIPNSSNPDQLCKHYH